MGREIVLKAILKAIHSPDISDLIHYKPDNEDTFGLLLQLFIKPNTEEGFESFDVRVVTPKWLAETHSKHDIVIGRHYLIVFEYNYEQIVNTINKFLLGCIGST